MRGYLIPFAVSMLASIVISPETRADTILVDPSVSGSLGAYTYSYEIENQSSVSLLLFSLTATGDVGTIATPTGWLNTSTIVGPGQTLVEWISTDVPYDVPALATLSGFSFMSDSVPGTVAFSTFDENFSEFDGQTTGPVASSVPEPNSFTLLVIALIGVCIIRTRRLI